LEHIEYEDCGQIPNFFFVYSIRPPAWTMPMTDRRRISKRVRPKEPMPLRTNNSGFAFYPVLLNVCFCGGRSPSAAGKG